MIKAPEFYEILVKYTPQIKAAGFVKKKGKNTFVSADDVTITFQTDKWGWLEEHGWGFLVRLQDMKGVDEKKYEQPRSSSDILPLELVDLGLISKNQLEALYKPYKKNVPKLYERINSPWYGFYDGEHLHEVLDTLLPAILEAAKDWADKQKAERKKPQEPPHRITEEEKRQIEKEIGGKFVT